MKKLLIVVAVIILSAGSLQAQTPRVPIFISTTSAGGFTDPSQDRYDSAVDLMKELKKSRTLQFVEHDTDAVAVIQVLGRETIREPNVWIGTQTKMQVIVRLTVGEFSAEFTGESGKNGGPGYRGAAKNVVRQLEAWVAENRTRLTSKIVK